LNQIEKKERGKIKKKKKKKKKKKNVYISEKCFEAFFILKIWFAVEKFNPQLIHLF
jgi:hypothetical protein